MSHWNDRPPEERSLLNPSFCSSLLWHAANGYQTGAHLPLPFEVAFLVLPMVLHREIRDSLPRILRTSVAVWIEENPLSRSRVADRARILVPFTKEAMMFGGVHGLLAFEIGGVLANTQWKVRIASNLKLSSEEVKICAKRAEFVGRWFGTAGSPGTLLAIFGVRP